MLGDDKGSHWKQDPKCLGKSYAECKVLEAQQVYLLTAHNLLLIMQGSSIAVQSSNPWQETQNYSSALGDFEAYSADLGGAAAYLQFKNIAAD